MMIDGSVLTQVSVRKLTYVKKLFNFNFRDVMLIEVVNFHTFNIVRSKKIESLNRINKLHHIQ